MVFDFIALGFPRGVVETVSEDTVDYRERLSDFLRGYTEEECVALHEKEMHPEKQVLCPRCGKELIYSRKGNSYGIKIPTCTRVQILK